MNLQKISSIHQFITEIQQILESHDLKWHNYFPAEPHTPIFFKQLLISMNLYQHPKYHISLFQRYIFDLQILQSD